ncbi:MAG: hypothetical protein KDH92_08450, partial [Chloroflexi bacterium]|nr:hypothetical protein [Chloroflexota bacterium]
MHDSKAGSLAQLTEANTREALRALRFAKPLAGSPLIHLAQVDAALAAEGLDDTPELRAWLLHRIVHTLSVTALARSRGLETLARDALTPEAFLAEMVADFRADAVDREAWSVLCLRHVAEARVANAELADRLGVTTRTVIRRLGRGYALLTDRLREQERAALRELAAAEGQAPRAATSAGPP